MEEQIVNKMCELARKHLIYLSYGEWDGSPEKLNDLDISFLFEMKSLCETAINAKLSKIED